MKKITEYMNYQYPIRIVRELDGVYCAEIEDIKGLCAYGKTPAKALQELDGVKEAAFELMISQGKEPPTPTVKLEIPEHIFRRLPGRRTLKKFVRT